MYYVYIMTNSNNRVLYTGVTKDLIRRSYEHRHHILKDSFTARYNVEKLVYYEAGIDAYGAISREKQIKGWNRKRKNQLVETMNPNWEDLYDRIREGRFSETPVRFGGLPRQSADWLAMTAFFHREPGKSGRLPHQCAHWFAMTASFWRAE